MLTWFIERVFFAESPLVWFLGLVLLTQVVYHYFLTQRMPSVSGCVVVMALGVVSVYLLPHFNTPLWLMTLISLELMIVWLYFTVNYLQMVAQDELQLSCSSDRLMLCAWVGGTAITGLLLEEADPLLYGCIIMLALISVIAWGVSMGLLWQPVCTAVRRLGQPVSGTLLLPSLASTLVILLVIELFNDDLPWCLLLILVLIAASFTLFGLVCLMAYWCRLTSARLMLAWPTANTLVYGALAALGLAMNRTALFPDSMIFTCWCLTMAAFVMVTCLEGVRVYWRWQCRGWRRVLLPYHPCAWFRITALSLLVAFTYDVWNQAPGVSVLMNFISNDGVGLVFLLAVIQALLMLKARAQWPK